MYTVDFKHSFYIALQNIVTFGFTLFSALMTSQTHLF